jgi:hypothetical protein
VAWFALVAVVASIGGCRRDMALPSATAPAQAGTASGRASPPATTASGGDSRAVPSAGAEGAPPPIPPRFVEVAKSSGIDFTYFNDEVPDRFFLPEVMGGGAAWIDYDRDGWLDLFITNGCRIKDPDPNQREHISRLYRNRGDGHFDDMTLASSAWHNGYGQGCSVGDYDADGFPDLFLANYGADVLFHNNGDGTFTRVTATAKTTDDDWSTSSAWFDADGDGLLDLYVVNYLNVTWRNHQTCKYSGKVGYCGPGEYQGVPDRLYVNQGDGTFVERLDAYGMSVPDGKGLTIAVLDLDDDLRPEVYVGNDMTPNFLFTRVDAALAKSPKDPAAPATSPGHKREAAGRANPSSPGGAAPCRYAEVGVLSGCAVSGEGLNEATMGVACADFDGDGLVDLYLSHYYNAKNTLYHNLGNLSFVDDSFSTRVAALSKRSLSFGSLPLDFDRDGAPDLFMATGHVLGKNVQPCAMTPKLLRNDGRGRFVEVSQFAGDYFRSLGLGRGVAKADYDNDGDEDLFVSHLDRPVVLLRNDTPTGRHFVGFDLRTPNRIPPVGGRVIVSVGKYRRVAPVSAGGGYLSASDTRLLFGLADEDGPVNAEILWPSGRVDKFDGLAVDCYWVVYEGQPPERLAYRSPNP